MDSLSMLVSFLLVPSVVRSFLLLLVNAAFYSDGIFFTMNAFVYELLNTLTQATFTVSCFGILGYWYI